MRTLETKCITNGNNALDSAATQFIQGIFSFHFSHNRHRMATVLNLKIGQTMVEKGNECTILTY